MRPSNALVNAPSEILVQHDKQLIFCLTGVSCFKAYMHTSWSGIQKLHCQFISKSNFRRLFQIRFLKFNMLSMVNKSPIGNENNHQLKKKEISSADIFQGSNAPLQRAFPYFVRYFESYFYSNLGEKYQI